MSKKSFLLLLCFCAILLISFTLFIQYYESKKAAELTKPETEAMMAGYLRSLRLVEECDIPRGKFGKYVLKSDLDGKHWLSNDPNPVTYYSLNFAWRKTPDSSFCPKIEK